MLAKGMGVPMGDMKGVLDSEAEPNVAARDMSDPPLHLGNVWACKDTVIVILVSAPAPFPWSWVGDWGLKAGQFGLRHDIRIYLKSAGWH